MSAGGLDQRSHDQRNQFLWPCCCAWQKFQPSPWRIVSGDGQAAATDPLVVHADTVCRQVDRVTGHYGIGPENSTTTSYNAAFEDTGLSALTITAAMRR